MRKTILFGCVTLALAACVEEPELGSFAERPSFEQWLETQTRVDAGYLMKDYLVEDLETMRGIYERSVGTHGALTVATGFRGAPKIWSASQRIALTYCISEQFTLAQATLLRDALKRASAAWEMGADVDFIHRPQYDGTACTDTNPNVFFNVRYFTCDQDAGWAPPAACTGPGSMPPCTLANVGQPCRAPFAGATNLPTSNRANRRVLIGSVSSLAHTPGKRNGVYSLLRHELGHFLGFEHEMAHPDYDGTNFPGCDENLAVAPLTGLDQASIMMYEACTPLASTWGYLSSFDVLGVAGVYPPPTNYDVVPADYNGDGRTDMAIRVGRGGNWFIDYTVVSSPFFPPTLAPVPSNGDWDEVVVGTFGAGTEALPGIFTDQVCPATGQKCAGLSVRDASGWWYIDHAYNGFGVWDASFSGYGAAASSTPAIADYDGDGMSDMAIKSSSGTWFIDYSSTPAGIFRFGAWNFSAGGYGDLGAIPVPADYDGDSKADLSIKSGAGEWHVDFSRPCTGLPSTCFGAWNDMNWGYGNASAVPVPGDYNGDLRADLAVRDNPSGILFIDYAAPTGDPYTGWDFSASGHGGTGSKPFSGYFYGVRPAPADFGWKSLTTWALEWHLDSPQVGGLNGLDQTIPLKP